MSRKWHEFTRPIVICLFCNEGRILADKGIDSVKEQEFYRPLGGMIEFGEHSSDAIKREIFEETNQEIKNLKYLGTLENIFTYEGKAGHEIVVVYDGEFVNTEMYNKTEIEVTEGAIRSKAYWLPITEVKEGKFRVYPEGIKDFI
ncbi:MAG: NUDIX domain-containing protein [Ignavibacteria bacterium]